MRNLTDNEKNCVKRVSDLLDKIFECFTKHATSSQQEMYAEEMKWGRKIAKAMKDMADDDEIKFVRENTAREAEATSDGILLNENYIGDVKLHYDFTSGDLKLGDCRKVGGGNFSHAWTFIQLFAHEYYHYENHTGWTGAARKVRDAAIHAPVVAVMLTKGIKLKSTMGHEIATYSYTRNWLVDMGSMLSIIRGTGCLDCEERHVNPCSEAARRQKFWDHWPS